MKSFVFIFLFLLPVFLRAQISLNQWISSSPVTDSSHNNRNACLLGQYNINIIFWDQETDAATTIICYKSLNDPLMETKIAIEQPGIKLTHPKLLELNTSTTEYEYLVIYQTNEGNDIDLKFMISNTNGTFSAPTILSALPGDDINLVVNQYMVAWENSGKIYAAEYQYENQTFTEPFLVEPNAGFSPVFRSNSLDYLVADTDSTKLISKQIQYAQGSWTVYQADTQSFVGQCSGANSYISWMGNDLAMQEDIAGKPSGIIISDQNFGAEYLRSPQYNYTEPAICDYIIGVKNSQFLYFLAYVSDSLTQPEIYAINPVMFSGPENISQWEGIDRNPRFFITFPENYYIRVYLFWESERNGFSTIYRSYLDYIFGGTEEMPKTGSISVSPCPFSRETTIRVQANGDIKFRVIDLQGREVKTLIPQKELDGWQEAVWDGTNNNGNEVSSGSYLVISNTADKAQSRIIIKQ